MQKQEVSEYLYKKAKVILPLFVILCLAPISINYQALACGGFNINITFMSFTLSTGNCGIADAICTVVGWFQGSLGKAIASLSVIFLGIQAFFGKITWGTVVLYAVGIFAIFGAEDIVGAFVGPTFNTNVC